jgi:hypothetical protein
LIWDKVLGLGTTDPLAGFAAITSNLVVSSYFIKPLSDQIVRAFRERWCCNLRKIVACDAASP